GGFDVQAVGEQVDLKRFADLLPGAKAVTLPERLFAFRSFMRTLPPISRQGNVSLSLPALVVGGAAIRDLVLEARPGDAAWNIAKLEATIPGRTQIRAAGELKTDVDFGFAGSVVVASNQPSGLAALLASDIDPAIRKLARAGIAADVELTPEVQTFRNMELDLDGDLLTGFLTHSFPQTGVETRTLAADLKGDVLDLDAAGALVALVCVNQETSEDQRLEAKLDLKGLEIASLATGPVVADVVLESRGEAAKLDIASLDVQSVAGLDVSANGTIDASGQQYDLTLKLEGATLAPALSVAAGQVAGLRPLIEHLISQPRLTEDTQMSLRIVTDNDAMNISGDGTTGGTRGTVALAAPADLTLELLRNADVKMSAQLTQPTPGRLFAQFAVPALGLPFEDTLRVDADFEGRLGASMAGRTVLRTNDDRVLLEGTVSQPAQYDAERRLMSQLRLDQRMDASLEDLGRWSTLFGRVLPNQIEGLPASAQGRLLVSDGTVEMRDAKGTFDNVPWAGDLTLKTDGRRPDLSGDLAVQTLSLDAVLEWVLGQGIVAESFVARGIEPFGANTLSGFDSDIRLSADTVATGLGQSLTDLRGQLRLDDGALSLNDGEASLAGTPVMGNLALSPGADASAIEINGTVAAAELNLIAPWAAALDGTASVGFDLQGTGATPADIVSQLTGSGTVSVNDLQIDGLNAGLLAGVLRSADEQEEPYSQDALNAVLNERLSTGRLAVPEIVVPFSVAGGEVRANALRLVGDDATLALNAEVDLAAGEVSLNGNLELDEGRNRIAGAQPEIAISYRGPIRAPSRQINGSGLASYLTLRAFEREQRRVELLQARILERQRLRREVRYYEVAKLEDEAAAERQAEADRLAEIERLAAAAALAAEQQAPKLEPQAEPEPEPEAAPEPTPEPTAEPATQLEPLPRIDLDLAPIAPAAPGGNDDLPPLENFDVETLPGLFTDSLFDPPSFAN
ncbi:MAG: AsmA-like C-terminal region-containing protein, partial [Pseudomonadota bacterium]